jgi:hypothetical protein
MAFWFCLFAGIALLLLLAALSRIKVRIRYSRSGEDDRLVVIVRALYGAYRYNAIIPAILFRGSKLVYGQQTKQAVAGQQFRTPLHWRKSTGAVWRMYGNRWVRHVLKKVQCTRFRLEVSIGTGDAPTTAVASGVLWSLYGCVLGLAGKLVTLKTQPRGGVQPVYGGREEFGLVWEADFHLRTGTLVWLLVRSAPGKAAVLRESYRSWRQRLKGPQSA